MKNILQNGTALDEIFILASKRVRENPVVNGKTSLEYFTERLKKFTSAGVEEFVQFGSVKTLDEYYKSKNLSPALKKLVNAMKNFAEEIKLCHYGQLKKAIEDLHDAIHDFKPGSANPQDSLMARLIGRISEDYELIIK